LRELAQLEKPGINVSNLGHLPDIVKQENSHHSNVESACLPNSCYLCIIERIIAVNILTL